MGRGACRYVGPAWALRKTRWEPLIGQAIDPEVYGEIKHFVEKYDGIEGTHDLIVHNYGAGAQYGVDPCGGA